MIQVQKSQSMELFMILVYESIPNYNKSNTEYGIIRPTKAIYMGSHLLLGSKAFSKCESDKRFSSNRIHKKYPA